MIVETVENEFLKHSDSCLNVWKEIGRVDRVGGGRANKIQNPQNENHSRRGHDDKFHQKQGNSVTKTEP